MNQLWMIKLYHKDDYIVARVLVSAGALVDAAARARRFMLGDGWFLQGQKVVCDLPADTDVLTRV